MNLERQIEKALKAAGDTRTSVQRRAVARTAAALAGPGVEVKVFAKHGGGKRRHARPQTGLGEKVAALKAMMR